jgi:hypothetical protein
MLTINDITYAIAGKRLLEGASATIPESSGATAPARPRSFG